MGLWALILLLTAVWSCSSFALPADRPQEVDGSDSRKVLGSSVVTSVSVILDQGNGTQAYFADAVGKPVSKPQTAAQVASPINLLSPDRYEFFTFNDNGDLIKKVMSLKEIQSIIANTDGNFNHLNIAPEKKVDDVVNNVQNVLKEEMLSHKPNEKPILDTPDVSANWNMILPSIFGNTNVDNSEVLPSVSTESELPNNNEEILNQHAENDEIVKGTTTTIKPDLITFFSVSTDDKKTTELTTKHQTNSVTIIPNSSDQETSSNEEDIITIKPVSSTYQTPTMYTNKLGSTLFVSTHLPLQTTQKTPEDIKTTSSLESSTFSKVQSTGTTLYNAPIDLSTASSQKPVVYITKPSLSSNSNKILGSTESNENQDLIGSATNTPSSTTHHITVEETSGKLPTTENIIITTKHDNVESSTELLKTSASETIRPYTSTVNYRPIIYLLTTTPENDPNILLNTLHNLNLESTTLANINKVTNDKLVNSESKETISGDKIEIVSSTNGNLQSTTAKTSAESSSEAENDKYDQTNYDETSQEEISLENSVNKESTTFKNDPVSSTAASSENTSANINKIDLSSTTEYLSVTELLDQLLQSTDIYAINSQLADPERLGTTSRIVLEKTELPNALAIDNDKKSTENPLAKENTGSTNLPSDGTALNDKEVNNKNTSIETTTEVINKNITIVENNLYQLVEQMIQNATDVEPAGTNLPISSDIVQDMFNKNANKTLEDINVQTATIASDILTNSQMESSTEYQKVPFNDALTTLISQIINGKPNLQEISSTTARVEENPIILTTKIAANNSKYRTEVPQDVHVIIYRTTPVSVDKKTNPSNLETTTLRNEKLNVTNGTDLKNENLNLNKTESDVLNKNATLLNKFGNIGNKEQDKTSSTTANFVENSSTTEKIDSSENKDSANRKTTLKPIENKIELTTNKVLNETKTTTIKNKIGTTNKPASVDKNNNKTEITALPLQTNATINKTKTESKHKISGTTTTTRKPIGTQTTTTNTVGTTPTTLQNKDKNQENPNNSTNNKQNGTNTEITPNLQSTVNKNKINAPNANKKPVKTNANLNNKQHNKTKIENNDKNTTLNHNKNNSKVPVSNNKNSTTPTKINSNNNKIQNQNQTKLEENKIQQENSSWTLVSMVPSSSNISTKPVENANNKVVPNINIEQSKPVDLVPQPLQGFGLEDSTSNLDTDIYKFVELCNELAFGFWQSVTTGISTARSVFTSPFAATSLLAMVFLGARGSTSGEMNEILKLDDMVTFNPHMIFRNISESIESTPSSGVAISAIIRELYSDRSKGKLLNFYKERARQFYDGHVEEASFREIGDIIRRRTNLLVKRQTYGKIGEYVKDATLTARPPLAGISASIFQTDCSSASTEGRDGELYFVVLPTIRQRRLIPVPAVVYRSGFVAGYDPGLDATAVALGSKDHTVSTIFVIPGQQGIAAPGDGLARLEKHLTDTAFKKNSWPRLLRSLIPRPGLEVQIPRFSHRSVINATVALQKMGLKDLFDSKKADLRGLNGVAHELHLSDLLQINTFATCGENSIDETHHSEIYPATATRPTSRRSRLFDDDIVNGGSYKNLREFDQYLSGRLLRENDKVTLDESSGRLDLKTEGTTYNFNGKSFDNHEEISSHQLPQESSSVIEDASSPSLNINNEESSNGGSHRSSRHFNLPFDFNIEEPRDYQRSFHDPSHDPSNLGLPLSLRPRQARLPEVPRLRFDRPFLYFVRHNPTGLILHMGRFNPRLLP